MLALEGMLLIAFVIMGVFAISKKDLKKPYGVLLLTMTGMVMILHMLFEGARWQMYPLYGAIVILGFLVYMKSIMGKSLKRLVNRGLIVGTITLSGIAFLALVSFPIYELPTPSGEHLVGTESFIIEDTNRTERYGDLENVHRTFKVQSWYPAQRTQGFERTAWIADGKTVSRALAKDIGLPYFFLDHTSDIESHAYLEAPISQSSDQYPVVILSHGWRGFRNLHTDYAEALASQGYIVIGIDHTYGSVATVLEEETRYLDPEALPPREITADFLDHANELVNTYASDVETTINYLEAMSEGEHASEFASALDLSALGLLGHSTGGGADVAVALRDERIKAVIGLDAWVEPIKEDKVENGLSIPSLFLRSGDWEISYNNDHLYTLIQNSTASASLYQIDGTTHYDFAMVHMYSPLTKYIGFSGSVESDKLDSMLRSMISDFFDGTLKNSGSSDINPDIWEEVRSIQVD